MYPTITVYTDSVMEKPSNFLFCSSLFYKVVADAISVSLASKAMAYNGLLF